MSKIILLVVAPDPGLNMFLTSGNYAARQLIVCEPGNSLCKFYFPEKARGRDGHPLYTNIIRYRKDRYLKLEKQEI